MTTTIKPEPGRDWLPWVLAGTLIGLWLFVPPFSITLGSFTFRHIELVRWMPLAIGLIACPRALLQWHWLDVPILLYCACPFLAGVMNQLDWSTSAWESVKEFSYWFVPYAIGRFYLTTETDRNAVAWCVLLGALLYIPPTLYEVYNGPTLAKWMTGQEFGRMLRGADRGDTFKPSVFLSSGFVLTMFYVWAVLIALHYAVRTFWVRFMPPMDRDRPIPKTNTWLGQGVLSGILMGIVVLCKSLGSIVLMAIGAAVILIARSRLAGVALATLCLLPPIYIVSRTTGIASSDRVDRVVRQFAPDVRAGSLKYRFDAEDLVFASMKGHGWWGYGTWGRWSEGQKGMFLDGFWLYAWTRTGMVCVVAWLTMVGLPILIVAIHAIRFEWDGTRSAGFPCAMFLALSLIDSMFNYFGEAPVMMCVGVVTAWAKELVWETG
jgi:hypothetical protein